MTSREDFYADYQQWTDLRVGLQYASWGGIVHYIPDSPFFVDGVRYDMRTAGPMYKRTMLEILGDRLTRPAEMLASRPPTDTELDHYVFTGLMDGRRL